MIDQCHTFRVAAPPLCLSRRVGARKAPVFQPGTCWRHHGSVCDRTQGSKPAAVASDVDSASHAPAPQPKETPNAPKSFDDLGIDERLTVSHRVLVIPLTCLPDGTRGCCERST